MLVMDIQYLRYFRHSSDLKVLNSIGDFGGPFDPGFGSFISAWVRASQSRIYDLVMPLLTLRSAVLAFAATLFNSCVIRSQPKQLRGGSNDLVHSRNSHAWTHWRTSTRRSTNVQQLFEKWQGCTLSKRISSH